MYFEYGDKEIEYLKSKDKKLAEAIDKIGLIYRKVDSDLFSAMIHKIVGQQISTKAQQTIWKRLNDGLVELIPEKILSISDKELQSYGLSFRKVSYIKDFTNKVYSGEFDIEALNDMNDVQVIESLSSLKGIGVWTAEMLMTFCMQRSDVISYEDLAILRSMRMLYHHRKITPEIFTKYKRRYSPYATVASLYLSAIAGGSIPDMRDYAPKKKVKK